MINESNELVSIIVPIYNRELILEKCVDSILQQTYKKIQLILVDDGSSDNSILVCKRFAKKDSRVTIIHQENGGPASARNTGMDIANGKYIMFVDSDDCIHPRCVELMYEVIQQYDVSLVMCEYGEKHQNSPLLPDVKTVIVDASTVLKNGLNETEKPFYCWGKLWKFEVIHNLRYKPYMYCEDTLFSIEVLLHCSDSIAFLKGTPLYYYLRRDNSITRHLSDMSFLDSLEIVETILRETDSCTDDIKKSAINYSVNTAFFAYLQAGNEKNSDLIRYRALKIIQKFRKNVLLNNSSLLKAKAACLISFFSMSALKVVYRLIKGQY